MGIEHALRFCTRGQAAAPAKRKAPTLTVASLLLWGLEGRRENMSPMQLWAHPLPTLACSPYPQLHVWRPEGQGAAREPEGPVAGRDALWV